MTQRTGRGPRALGAVMPEVARKSLRRGGATLARLMAEWPTIVGPKLARDCLPRRLSDREGDGATLVLSAQGPIALELQHLEPLLIERINGHLGYAAIKRVRLVQDGARRPPAGTTQPLAPSASAAAPQLDAGSVDDDDLRRALIRLGEAVANRPPRAR